jgi:hypothetical protein
MGSMKRNQKKITKGNEILLMTKQYETKFRCFSCFAKQAKFRETIFCFDLFRVSQKKCEMETLTIGGRCSCEAKCNEKKNAKFDFFPCSGK